MRASASYFKGGEAKLELVEAHTWADTVVLVMIERQHGQVGGLPDQDWSLRVTQVYRRDGSDWQVVHRHADPLFQSNHRSAAQVHPSGRCYGEKLAVDDVTSTSDQGS